MIEFLKEAKDALDAIDAQTADHRASGGQVSFLHSSLVSFGDNLKRAKEAVESALGLAEPKADHGVDESTKE